MATETKILGKLVPSSALDTYPTHDEEYGRGGYRAVSTVQERDAIPADRLKLGMEVRVTSENKVYYLDSVNPAHWSVVKTFDRAEDLGLNEDTELITSDNFIGKFNEQFNSQLASPDYQTDYSNRFKSLYESTHIDDVHFGTYVSETSFKDLEDNVVTPVDQALYVDVNTKSIYGYVNNKFNEIGSVSTWNDVKAGSRVKFYTGIDAAYNKNSFVDCVYFATNTGKIYVNGVSYGSVNVDSTVSATSNNPVSSAAVYSKIQEVDNKLANYATRISGNYEGGFLNLNLLNSKLDQIGSTLSISLDAEAAAKGIFSLSAISPDMYVSSKTDSAELRFTFKNTGADGYAQPLGPGERLKHTLTLTPAGSEVGYTLDENLSVTNNDKSTGGYNSINLENYLKTIAITEGVFYRVNIHSAIVDTDGNEIKFTNVNWTYAVFSLKLESSFNVAVGYPLGSAIPLAYKTGGTSSAKRNVMVYVDGTLIEDLTRTGISGDQNVSLNIATGPAGHIKTTGSHTIQLTSVYPENTEICSNSLLFSVAVTDNNTTDPIITAIFDLGQTSVAATDKMIDIQQFDSYSLQYYVWYPSNITTKSPVQFYSDGELLGETQVTTTISSFSYRYLTAGSKNCTIQCGNTTYNYTVRVSASTLSLQDINGNLKFYVDAYGKSNSASNQNWSYGTYGTSFQNFKWGTSNGWFSDKDGAYLQISNGAVAKVNYDPFDPSNVTSNAVTFSIRFKVTNVISEDEVLLSCVDANKTGFILKASEASFRTRTGKIVYTKFATDEVYNIAVVSYPKMEGNPNSNMIYFYINGVISAAIKKDDSDSIAHATAGLLNIPITMTATTCTLKVYSIRAYNTYLEDDQMLDASLVDLGTYAQLEKKYLVNDCAEGNAINRFKTDLPYMIITGQDQGKKGVMSTVEFAAENNNKEDKYPVYSILFVDPLDQSKNFYSITKIPSGEKSLMNVENCPYIRLQGTSSLSYPVKNYRIYTKKAGVYVGCPATTNSQNYKELDSKTYQKKGLYALADNALPTDCWTLKADYAESSSSHNTGTANMVHDVLAGVGSLTPAQTFYNQSKGESKIELRTTVQGRPMLLYYRQTETDTPIFAGKFNLNNDKSNTTVYGFEDVAGYNGGTVDNSKIFNGVEKVKKYYMIHLEDYTTEKANELAAELLAANFNPTQLNKNRGVADDADNELRMTDLKGKVWTIDDTEYNQESKEYERVYTKAAIADNMNITAILFSYSDAVAEVEEVSHSATKEEADAENAKHLVVDSNEVEPGEEGYLTTYEEDYVPMVEGDKIIDTPHADAKPAGWKSKGEKKWAINRTECWEFSSNDYTLGKFIYDNFDINYFESKNGELTKTGYKLWYQTWESRYPGSDYDAVEFQWAERKPHYLMTVAKWLTSTCVYTEDFTVNDSDEEGNLVTYKQNPGPTNELLDAPVNYSGVNYTHDTEEYRLAKFKAEFSLYFDPTFTCDYYNITDILAAADQRVKNMMWAFFYDPTIDMTNPDIYAREEATGMYGMRVYPIFYDNDTILGIDNNGEMTIPWDADENTLDNHDKYCFAGHEATEWENMRRTMQAELNTSYNKLRAAMTDAVMYENYDTKESDQWCERIYNKDSVLKYITPNDPSQYPKLQGTRKAHRHWFIGNRMNLFDAKYDSTTFQSDQINWKGATVDNEPRKIRFTMARDYYAGLASGEGNAAGQHVFVPEGEETMFQQLNNTSIGSIMYLYGVRWIKSLDYEWGGMNTFSVVGTFKSLEELTLGHDTCQSWNTSNFPDFNNFPLLKKLTCYKWLGSNSEELIYSETAKDWVIGKGNADNVQISNLLNLEELSLYQCTGATSVKFPEGGALREVWLPKQTVTLNLTNLPSLATDKIHIEEDVWSNVTSLMISNSPLIEWKTLLNRIKNNKKEVSDGATTISAPINIYIDGINETGDGALLRELMSLGVQGYANGPIDSYAATSDKCTLVGTYTLTKLVSDSEYATLKAYFPLLDIQQPDYTLIQVNNNTKAAATIINLDNNTTGVNYQPSGYISKILNQRHGYLVQYQGDGAFDATQLDDTDHNLIMATGAAADLTGSSGDYMIYEPQYWYKGINDFKNTRLYVAFTTKKPKADAVSVNMTATQFTNVNTLADLKDGNATRLSNFGVYITGRRTLDTSVTSMSGVTTFLYKLPEEHKFGLYKVQCYMSTTYGAVVLDSGLNIISSMMASGETGATNKSYLFDSIPANAYAIAFTVGTSSITTEPVLTLIESSDIADVEAGWVEHKEIFCGRSISLPENDEIKSFQYADQATYSNESDGKNVKDVQPLVSNRDGNEGYYLAFDYEAYKDIIVLAWAKYGTTDLANVVGLGGATTVNAQGLVNNDRQIHIIRRDNSDMGMNDSVGLNDGRGSGVDNGNGSYDMTYTSLLMGYERLQGRGTTTSLNDVLDPKTFKCQLQRVGRSIQLYPSGVSSTEAFYLTHIQGGKYVDLLYNGSTATRTSLAGFCGTQRNANSNITSNNYGLLQLGTNDLQSTIDGFTSKGFINILASTSSIFPKVKVSAPTDASNMSKGIENAVRLMIAPKTITFK